jgi:hypothetical protein
MGLTELLERASIAALAEREAAAIDELIARKQAADSRIDYATGWRMLLSERPDLMQSYSRAATARELAAIDKEIATQLAANPKLDYMRCWMLLASERSPLLVAYNDAAALRPPQSRSSQTVAMSEHPLASVLVPIEEKIHLLQHENPNMTFAEAWRQVGLTHPDLIKNYNRAAGHKPGDTAPEALARNLALIDEQIRNRRQTNPGLTYAEAWKIVEKERPDLTWAYNDAAAHAGTSDSIAAQRTGAVGEGGPGAQGTVAMRANR